MPLRLPRMGQMQQIVRTDGGPVQQFQSWFNTAMEKIENSINGLTDAIADIAAAQADADAANTALENGAILVKDEGGAGAETHTLNFAGAGVSAAVAAGVATVTVPGASGVNYEAGPPTPPTAADLATWDNQGTSTVSDGTGAMIIKPQVDALPHGRIKAAPATPWSLYVRTEVNTLTSNTVGTAYSCAAGIILKDTGGDNERLTFAVGQEHNASGGDDTKLYYAAIQRWTGASPPVFSSTPVIKYAQHPWKWLKVDNDGTTLTLSASFDGKNWAQVGTETLAAFIDGAASFGVYAYGSAATEVQAAFSYFSTTAPA